MTFYFNRVEIIEELDQLPDEKKLSFINKKLHMLDRYYAGVDPKSLPLEVRGLKQELIEKKVVYEKFDFDQVDQNTTQKIKWNGTEAQLVYLFQELVKAKLLPDDFLSTTGEGYKLIESHFINKKGKPLKNTQLAQTYQNLGSNKESKPKNPDKIDKLITKTKRKKV